MPSTTTWLLLAGAVGLGAYAYSQRKKATQVAAVTETKPPTSFFDSLLGPAKEAAKLYATLSAKTLAMGMTHHKAWRVAMKQGVPFYNVGIRCYATRTANLAERRECLALELE